MRGKHMHIRSIESPPEPQKPQVLLCFDCPFNL